MTEQEGRVEMSRMIARLAADLRAARRSKEKTKKKLKKALKRCEALADDIELYDLHLTHQAAGLGVFEPTDSLDYTPSPFAF